MLKMLNKIKRIGILVLLLGLVIGLPQLSLAQEEVFELEEEVVTEDKTENLLKDIATVITKEEIEAANVENIADVLKLISYVFQIQNYSPTIHGLPALVLIDGQMVHTGGCPGRGRVVELDNFSVDQIERIEIITGGQSVLYGEDAMGGVINIITKSAEGKPTFSASSSFASRNTRVYSVSHGYKPGKFGYNLGYSHRSSDGEEPDNDKKIYNEVWTKYGYEFNAANKLTFMPKYWEKTTFSSAKKNDPSKNYMFSTLWSFKPDDVSVLNLEGSFLNREYNTNYEKQRKEAKMTYNRPLFVSHSVTCGYHFWEDLAYDKTIDCNGIFLQDEMNFDPFIVTLGVRNDKHSQYGNYFSPSAGVFYKINDDIKLKLSAGKGTRYNTFAAVYYDEEWSYSRGQWTYRPFDLKPECLMSYQAGIDYRISKNLMSKVSIFKSDCEDKIQKVDTDTQITRDGKTGALWEYKNIAKSLTQGMDVEFLNQLAKNLFCSVGYSFLDSEDKTTGKELTYMPKHKFNIGLNWKIPDYGLSTNLRSKYVGCRYRDSGNTEELPDYNLMDINVTKNITKFARLGFSVENIFDKDTSYTYLSRGKQYTKSPEPGRTYKAEIKVNF